MTVAGEGLLGSDGGDGGTCVFHLSHDAAGGSTSRFVRPRGIARPSRSPTHAVGPTRRLAADDDRATIEKLSRQPGIVQRLARSIAPSIYGNDNVKMVRRVAMAVADTGADARS